MWRPAERIKYVPEPGAVPDQSKAEKSRLFSPVELGPVTLAERTWVPAMVPWRATEEGHTTEALYTWYERFAKGQPGAVVVEATGIRDVPSGPLLRIGHDRYIPGLKDLVDRMKVASDGRTKVFIQLIDFLRINRRPPADKFFQKYLKIDDRLREALASRCESDDEIRELLAGLDEDEQQTLLSERDFEALTRGYRERVTDTHLDHVRDLPQALPTLFADAAIRAQKAGFDGIELHYAHAYTMASFLSARNTRTDGYGTDLEGRVRLPLEVLAAVREAVGPDMAVGCRYLSEDCIDGGMSVDDAAWFGARLAEAGMDFLSLSRGGKFEDAKQPKVGAAAYPYTGRSGYECMPQYISDEQGPFGRNLAPTAKIRQAVRAAGFDTPVVAAGGIYSFAQAEQVLENDGADIVGAARQSLADPDWFLKLRTGHGDKIRLCLYTNYCEALDTRHKQVTCELWDRQDLDTPGLLKSFDGKRRLNAPDWSAEDDA
ncbi:MAG: NADH:flavin oxidoreductase [Pseudomonadota bacterium]